MYLLEESNYTLTWSEDDRTALRIVEVVFFGRSGRFSQKPDSSRAELRLGNLTSRDLQDLGTCFGAREWYRGFGVLLARKTMQNGREKREKEQMSRLPSHPIYRRLKPRSTLGVQQYAGRTRPNRHGMRHPKNSSARDVTLRCTLGVLRMSPMTPLRIIPRFGIKFKY